LASGATARATSAGSATALGAWIISTALAPGSCSSTSIDVAVALGRGVADDVDRIGARPRWAAACARSAGRKLSADSAASWPPPLASASAAITPGPPPLVEDRQPLAVRCGWARARVSTAANSSSVVRHAQHAGAPDRGVVDIVGAGQRAGVRGAARRRPRACGRP
jgi:hypothetical protein